MHWPCRIRPRTWFHRHSRCIICWGFRSENFWLKTLEARTTCFNEVVMSTIALTEVSRCQSTGSDSTHSLRSKCLWIIWTFAVHLPCLCLWHCFAEWVEPYLMYQIYEVSGTSALTEQRSAFVYRKTDIVHEEWTLRMINRHFVGEKTLRLQFRTENADQNLKMYLCCKCYRNRRIDNCYSDRSLSLHTKPLLCQIIMVQCLLMHMSLQHCTHSDLRLIGFIILQIFSGACANIGFYMVMLCFIRLDCVKAR